MLGGNNNNSLLPVYFGENRFQREVNVLPQPQLFRDVRCLGGSIKHMGNDHTTTMERPAKRGRIPESISRQKKPLSNNFQQHEAGQHEIVLDPNLVSIGLKISYEEERNSSVAYASGHKTAVLPIMSSLDDSIKPELERQKEEFDHHIRLQEENMIKGMREVVQGHAISFLSAIETGIGRKLHQKELEIQNMNRKNNDLVERIKQMSAEVQLWQHKARHNESIVNTLKSNLKEVMAKGVIHGKEGCGESEVDGAASYANQNYTSMMEANTVSFKLEIMCRACKTKESTILLLPCRHLCLCKDCVGFIDVCPICQIMRTAGVEVFLS